MFGGAAALWPVGGRAQQPALPVVGFLNARSAAETKASIAGFTKGLREAGFDEGRNVAFEYRWADGHYDRLPAFAADLVRRRVTVIAAGGGPVSALAAKKATSTIPIVFMGGSDPVANGLVASFSRPGGNVTGVLNVASQLTAKRLDILRELKPAARSIAVLRNPAYPEADLQVHEIEIASAQMKLKVHFATARSERDFEPALEELVKQGPDALFVANDPYFASQRAKLIPLVARYRIPAVYSQREYVEAGGLMSYGTNFADLYQQAGVYIGRILKGEKPADLPVTQPTRFELVINRRTATALGLELPAKLLALADDVID
jgi:putative ABC transport system substrate-binding protein